MDVMMCLVNNYKVSRVLGIIFLMVTFPVSVPLLLLEKDHTVAAWIMFIVESALVVLYSIYGNRDHLFI